MNHDPCMAHDKTTQVVFTFEVRGDWVCAHACGLDRIPFVSVQTPVTANRQADCEQVRRELVSVLRRIADAAELAVPILT